MKRKFLSLFVLGFASLGLFGCGNASDSSEVAVSSSSEASIEASSEESSLNL